MSKNISIVGTRGAGKSVFISVLAKHLSTPQNGVLLIPDSYEVDEYVDLNYAMLQRGTWIPSTNTEQPLSWKLKVGDNEQQLSLMDIPGEDLQRLFARREYESEDILDSDRSFIDSLLGSSTVLVLINLQDFLDNSYEEENVRAKKLKEHSLKEFLTALKKDDRRNVGIVFTAYNQFQTLVNKDYGNVVNFLKKETPALFYEHVQGNSLPAFKVSAVAQTVRTMKSKDGAVPKPGFTHKGLDPVIEFLVDPAQYVHNFKEKRKKKKSSKAKSESNPTEQVTKGKTNVDISEWTDW